VGCAGCHAQPAVGGTSPAVNPLFRVAGDLGFGANNVIPSFITPNGPIREARFQFNPDGSRDGGVHALFVIAGHPPAPGCDIRQEDFERQVRNDNIIFRIPTPVFGAGLIEHARTGTATTGTITRFGWKAQNKSLLIFSGEAYNVEMGITNEGFQQKRDENLQCQFATVPNDVTPSVNQIGAIENFSNFQRFLAPPTPASNGYGNVSKQSIDRGRALFASVGCVHCHTPTLTTGNATVAALRGKNASLYSDLALHGMGPGLADDIVQGLAQGHEFRTAPLWGLGQRIFFLHDGRTTDLLEAIRAHQSFGNFRFPSSEANAVIDNFNNLRESDQQDLMNFLRSL
jgi:hypothetical protein